MGTVELGKIKVLLGENGGRFPFNNSLFIDDEIKVIVDPGASYHGLLNIRQRTPIDLVINTHYHIDHIAYNYIFDEAKVLLNDLESEYFLSREEIVKDLVPGIVESRGEEWIKEWIDRISLPDGIQSPYSPQYWHEWWLSTARLDETYKWGEVFDFGTTRMEVIGAPGHTAGFCCLYFPDEGVVYTGDIDLSEIGPWYCGRDSDIEQFITSSIKVACIDADIFVTGHEAGILSRKAFTSRLERYLDLINQREQRLISVLHYPRSLNQITNLGIIFGKKVLADEWIRAWEEAEVKKHLKRMMRRDLIVKTTNKKFVMNKNPMYSPFL